MNKFKIGDKVKLKKENKCTCTICTKLKKDWGRVTKLVGINHVMVKPLNGAVPLTYHIDKLYKQNNNLSKIEDNYGH